MKHNTKMFPKPNGDIQGDDRPIPSAGTGTGVSRHGMVTHDKKTQVDATNSMGSIRSATRSDPPTQTRSPKV